MLAVKLEEQNKSVSRIGKVLGMEDAGHRFNAELKKSVPCLDDDCGGPPGRING